MLNQYQRRSDLIPNLVETVKGFAKQESSVLEAVTAARAAATSVKVDAGTITDPEAFKTFQEAQAQLSGSLGRLLAISEAYPDLKCGAALAAVAWVSLACAAMTQAPAATSLTFPALTRRVVDEAGLLPAADRATLAASLAGLEAKMMDQLVVVTLKSLQGTTIEDYGYQLGRRWGIGQKDKDSGVLLIVAAAERRVRIEVGYGLEGTLTDAATRLIIENLILPAFKAGDVPGGIKGGVSGIIQVLGGDAGALPRAAA